MQGAERFGRPPLVFRPRMRAKSRLFFSIVLDALKASGRDSGARRPPTDFAASGANSGGGLLFAAPLLEQILAPVTGLQGAACKIFLFMSEPSRDTRTEA